MASATRARTAPPTGVVMEGVSWADYETQLRIIGDRHIRVNYDSGSMELMSPLRRHGQGTTLLGWMVLVLVEELDVESQAADPVTLKRADLAKGVEPDRLFHFGANAARVREPREFDFAIDPPPDLVIEVDVTSSSVPRLPIFAALGIPEVWRVDEDDELRFLHLQPNGTYRPVEQSRAFPALSLEEAARWLDQGEGVDMTAWIKGFRAFVREVIAPRHRGELAGDR